MQIVWETLRIKISSGSWVIDQNVHNIVLITEKSLSYK